MKLYNIHIMKYDLMLYIDIVIKCVITPKDLRVQDEAISMCINFRFLRSPHKLNKFNVGEGRYHITTGTRELSPVVTGVGMALGGEEESAGQGVNVQ